MRYLIAILLLLSSCRSDILETKIDLRDNSLERIPDSIFRKSNLTELNLGARNITFYPPLSVVRPKNTNRISEIPEEIGNLILLRTLILNTNRIKALPAAISKLKNLQTLDLSDNPDLDIVNEIEKIKSLPNLKTLKIVDVRLKQIDTTFIRKSLNPNCKIVFDIFEYFK